MGFLGRWLQRLDEFQQGHPWLALPLATLKRFDDDGASGLAAAVAYYAFFSLFPLLLVVVTVLGFVLADHPAAYTSVRHSVLGHFPVIGQSLQGHTLQGHAGTLVIAILISLYAGLGVTGSAGQALDHVWAVPHHERPNFFHSRLRGLLLLASLGMVFIIATGASGIVSSGLISSGLGASELAPVGIVLSIALNFALFMISFRVLCSVRPPWRELVPGALLSAVIWEVLQLIGGIYINHIHHSYDAYGDFALVLGVLVWLHLGAQGTTFAAELNVVIARREWPRPLFGAANPDAAAEFDRAVDTAADTKAKAEAEALRVRRTARVRHKRSRR
jgi:inner membrane protein YhjD